MPRKKIEKNKDTKKILKLEVNNNSVESDNDNSIEQEAQPDDNLLIELEVQSNDNSIEPEVQPNDNLLIEELDIQSDDNLLFEHDNEIDNTEHSNIINEIFIPKLINLDKISSENNNILSNYSLGTINNMIDKINIKEYVIDENIINNILNEDDENILINDILDNENILINNMLIEENSHETKYNLDNLKLIFDNFKKSIMIIQIIDGVVTFIEKKGYESRNQSIIDLLIKANNYKKLPNIQFLFFTDDMILDKKLNKFPFLFTFCKNYDYKTTLFPNFNFNHWLESNTGDYETVYNNLVNDKISWDQKKNIVFWTGSNTNTIRKKIHSASKKYPNYYINLVDNKNNSYLPLNEILKYKYLINMNGYSYSGRLNYLFLSSSCVIILKNSNKEHIYEEYYYKYFIPNEDYIEIIYDDKENPDNIINRINVAIQKNDCETIAKKCFEKAQEIFKINNIYEYIHNTLTHISYQNDITTHISNSICYTPNLNYFFKNRLKVIDNQTNFYFNGQDFELNLIDKNNSKINIKIINDKTKINCNDKLIYEKFTPMILNLNKSQHYNIIISDNELKIIIEKKFTLIKCNIPIENFYIDDIQIKTELGGSWLIE